MCGERGLIDTERVGNAHALGVPIVGKVRAIITCDINIGRIAPTSPNGERPAVDLQIEIATIVLELVQIVSPGLVAHQSHRSITIPIGAVVAINTTTTMVVEFIIHYVSPNSTAKLFFG